MPPSVLAAQRHYGGFRVGPLALALPMSVLREVVPCQDLKPMAGGAGLMAGTLALRGVMLPVLDLHQLLHLPPAEQADPAVVVMLHDGRLLGLRVDGVNGVFDAEPGSLKSVACSEGGSLLMASVRRLGQAEPLGVLDPQALAALPGVPWIEDAEPQRRHRELQAEPEAAEGAAGAGGDADATAAGALSQDRPMMLMRSGPLAFAIDALAVHATASAPRLRPSVLARGACLGALDFADRDVPALDLLRFTGFDAAALVPDADTQAVVLQVGDGLVALLVERVVDVVRCSADAVAPLPGFALRRSHLLDGVLPADRVPAEVAQHALVRGRPFLVLNAQALRSDAELLGLSEAARGPRVQGAEAGTRAGAAARGGAAGPLASMGSAPAFDSGQAGDGLLARAAAGSGLSLVTYALFGESGTPIEQIDEILPFDPRMPRLQGQGAVMGVQVHRGRTIPLVCLCQLAGAPAPAHDADSSVLVVSAGPLVAGFVVPRLKAIEAAQGSLGLPEHAVTQGDPVAQALQSHRLARIGRERDERRVRVLDLRAAVRAMAGVVDEPGADAALDDGSFRPSDAELPLPAA